MIGAKRKGPTGPRAGGTKGKRDPARRIEPGTVQKRRATVNPRDAGLASAGTAVPGSGQGAGLVHEPVEVALGRRQVGAQPVAVPVKRTDLGPQPTTVVVGEGAVEQVVLM